MLTIVIHMTVKADRENECAAVCEEVMKSTRSQDEGCLSYTFYRRTDAAYAISTTEALRL